MLSLWQVGGEGSVSFLAPWDVVAVLPAHTAFPALIFSFARLFVDRTLAGKWGTYVVLDGEPTDFETRPWHAMIGLRSEDITIESVWTYLDASCCHVKLCRQFRSQSRIWFSIALEDILEDFELSASRSFAVLDFIGGVGIKCAEVDRGGVYGTHGWVVFKGHLRAVWGESV